MSKQSDIALIAKNPVLRLDITSTVTLIELTEQINSICARAEEKSPAVVIFQFMDGPFSQWPGPVSVQDVNRWERAVRRVEKLATVILAVIAGIANGPVLDLLLCSDYRIVSTDFKLQVPVNRGHIWPGMAMYRLVNQVGLARSRQIFMGIYDITAQWAFDVGLIDEISAVPFEASNIALSRLNAMSSTELSIRRQLMLEAQSTPFDEALGTYLAACDRELRRLRGYFEALGNPQ